MTPITYQRVMFVGNSLTMHPPRADVGWTGYWGMAATQPDLDYVHRTQLGMAARQGIVPEIAVVRSDFTFLDLGAWQKIFDFQPQLIVVQMGDNAPLNATHLDYVNAYNSILPPAQAVGARVILLGLWGNHDIRDEWIQSIATGYGAEFMMIADLHTPEGEARHVRDYMFPVDNHPNDMAMSAIAERLLGVIY